MTDKPMTPDEFYRSIEAIRTNDPEKAHYESEAIVFHLLSSLGYHRGVGELRALKRWYS